MATSSPGDRHRILGIEVCRGVAAILVILYHVSRHIDSAYKAPLLKSVLQFGHAGVDLFFVISGFIILYVHYDDVGNPKQLARYIRRRLTRIFPTYWVALALTIAMMFHHGVFTAADLFWSAFLLPSDRPLILGIAWTLRFEILFYAMFCVAILHRGAGFALLAGWFALSEFCAASGTKIGFLPDQFQSAFVLEFLFGMVAAFLAKEQFVHGPRVVLAVGVSLFACSALLEITGGLNGFGSLARIAYGISSGFLILGLAGLAQARASSAPDFLRSLGAASYSLYIFQFVFIGAAWQLLLKSGAATMITPFEQFLILSGVAIVGGVMTSKVVEQPLIRLCRMRVSAAAANQLPS